MDHHGNGVCLGDGWNRGGLVGDGGQASVSSNTQFTYILAYSTLNTAELLYPKNTFFSFLSFFLNSRSGKKPDCIEAKLRRAPPGVHQRTGRPPPAPMI